jgi:flagellar protein FlaG
MALEISSNTHSPAGNAVPRPSVAASPSGASADVKSHLTPIPKAEIKIDLERESQDLRAAIGKLNDMMQANARSVSFAMDEKLGRPIVYIKNATTGEIVRQIPNEVIVQLAHSIEDFKGLLHNEKI